MLTHWFTTAAFIDFVREGNSDDLKGSPRSLAHAKRMGTHLTACGQSAYTWVKLWELPFDEVPSTRCPDCLAVLSAASQTRTR